MIRFWKLSLSGNDSTIVDFREFDLRISRESSVKVASIDEYGLIFVVGTSEGKISIFKVGDLFTQGAIVKQIDLDSPPSCLVFDPNTTASLYVGTTSGEVVHIFDIGDGYQHKVLTKIRLDDGTNPKIAIMEIPYEVPVLVIATSQPSHIFSYNLGKSVLSKPFCLFDDDVYVLRRHPKIAAMIAASYDGSALLLYFLGEKLFSTKLANRSGARRWLDGSFHGNGDLLVLSDDLGRIELFHPLYSLSHFRLILGPQSLGYEEDEFILDDNCRAISITRKRHFEDILPRRQVNISTQNISALSSIWTTSKPAKDKIVELDTPKRSSRKLPFEEATSFKNAWLLSERPESYYMPQIFDRVVIIRKSLMSLIAMDSIFDSTGCIGSLDSCRNSSEIYFGTVVSVDYVNFRDRVLKCYDVCLVEDFDSLQPGEIPLSRFHVRILFDLAVARTSSILPYELFARMSTRAPSRGDRMMTIDGLGNTVPVSVVGELRSSDPHDKLYRARAENGTSMTLSKFELFELDELPIQADHAMRDKCLALGKKLKALLRSSSFQKSVNFWDYIIEGKDDMYKVSVKYPVTVSMMVKRLEYGYYRRPDSLYADLDDYRRNLDSCSPELVGIVTDSIDRIRTIAKTIFSARKNTRR